VAASFLVADARFLPFTDETFDTVFSYSVLQHLSRPDCRQALGEVRRVLRPDGSTLIQMANALGPRSLYHQLRRGFRSERDFEVRYWLPWRLKSAFRELVGPSTLSVDGILTLNPQPSDARLLPWRYRAVVRLSSWWRRLSPYFPPLKAVADSLYVSSRRDPGAVE
jgi:SAM-dependent methyltransferase